MSCGSGCSTLGELVARAARVLNDFERGNEHVRWQEAELIDYINEALCRVLARRPDAFAETFDFALQPGRLQRLPGEYLSLSGIELSKGKDGDTPVSEVDHRFSKIFSKKPCLARDTRCDNRAAKSADPCADFKITGFAKNPLDEAVFTVDPPVPKGCAPTVTMTAIRKPEKFCGQDGAKCLGIACEYESPVLDFVLWRALSKDHESAPAAAQAKLHFDAFERVVVGDYLMEQRYGSGYYRGQEGQGDPQFRAR